ncbi:MAG TPA: GNAT family protein [Thermoleophilaceae bacterium]|nr:GNAT family protein [Thermoleophilaceae bacterium]
MVVLSGWRQDDAAARARAFDDPDVERWSRMPFPYTVERAAEGIRRGEERHRNGELVPFAIRDMSGTLLGGIDLMFRGDGRAELGYAVGASGRGRGVATRAVLLVGRWAMDTLGIRRLELPIPVDNSASRRVAERAGYTREGVLRSFFELRPGHRVDVVMYALIAEPSSPQSPSR